MRPKISTAPLSDRNRPEVAISSERSASGTAIEPTLARSVAYHLSPLPDAAGISNRSVQGRPAHMRLDGIPGYPVPIGTYYFGATPRR